MCNESLLDVFNILLWKVLWEDICGQIVEHQLRTHIVILQEPLFVWDHILDNVDWIVWIFVLPTCFARCNGQIANRRQWGYLSFDLNEFLLQVHDLLSHLI